MSYSRFRQRYQQWGRNAKKFFSAYPNIQFGLELGKNVFVYTVVINFAYDNTLSPTFCSGASMEPTIKASGEFVIVDKFSYNNVIFDGNQYEEGDIVIARCPIEPTKRVCKRIIKCGPTTHLYRYKPNHPLQTIYIPPEHVWLEGDNAWNSSDSRYYGPVSIGLLEGKCIWKINMSEGWPWARRLPTVKPPIVDNRVVIVQPQQPQSPPQQADSPKTTVKESIDVPAPTVSASEPESPSNSREQAIKTKQTDPGKNAGDNSSDSSSNKNSSKSIGNNNT